MMLVSYRKAAQQQHQTGIKYQATGMYLYLCHMIRTHLLVYMSQLTYLTGWTDGFDGLV